MRVKALLGLVLGIAILLGLYFFVKPTFLAKSQPLEKMTVGSVSGDPKLAFVASEKGYFTEHGLSVTMKPYEQAPQMIQDLRMGKIAIASSAEFLFVRNSFKGDLKILASTSRQTKRWELVARKDKGIATVSDLKGKKIGVQKQTIGEFFLGDFLTLNHISPEDVTVLDRNLPTRLDQIKRGELDAVVVLEPATTRLKKALANNAVSFDIQNDQGIFTIAYTTDHFVKTKPQTIKKYLLSLTEAESFVSTHPNDARTIVQKELHYTNAEIDTVWPEFTFQLTLPQELILTMEDEARWMIENHLTNVQKVPDYLDAMYFDGLENIDKNAVTIIH